MTDLVVPAPLLRRLGAAFYDSLLLVAIWVLGLLLVTIASWVLKTTLPPRLVWAGLFLIGGAFFGRSWTHGGQTLGMLAWQLQVRRDDGAPLRWPIAAIRYVGLLATWSAALAPFLELGLPATVTGPAGIDIAAATATLTLAGIIGALIDGRRRLPHDWLSGTEVVMIPERKAGKDSPP